MRLLLQTDKTSPQVPVGSRWVVSGALWFAAMAAGTAGIVWGAEKFAEHLADASTRLGVSAFALAILLAGAEPEELATVVTASACGVDGVAFRWCDRSQRCASLLVAGYPVFVIITLL